MNPDRVPLSELVGSVLIIFLITAGAFGLRSVDTDPPPPPEPPPTGVVNA
jgi:hypothetical protein